MVSLQFLNPLMQKYGHALLPMMRSWVPYLWLLPSSSAGDAVNQSAGHHWGAAVLKLGGLAIYTAIFTVFLWMRYAQLYSGEELSEGVVPARKAKRAALSAEDSRETVTFLPPQVRAVFRKELLYLKRNTFLFFGLIFPPMMLLFFSVQFAGPHPTAFKKGVPPDLFFPGIMAYLVLILIAPSYNCCAYEGTGSQTYFTAPARFREILLSTNLTTVSIILCELV